MWRCFVRGPCAHLFIFLVRVRTSVIQRKRALSWWMIPWISMPARWSSCPPQRSCPSADRCHRIHQVRSRMNDSAGSPLSNSMCRRWVYAVPIPAAFTHR
jgi:hypothetical protein